MMEKSKQWAFAMAALIGLLTVAGCWCAIQTGDEYECTCTVPSDSGCMNAGATFMRTTDCMVNGPPGPSYLCTKQCQRPPDMSPPPDMSMPPDLRAPSDMMSMPVDLGTGGGDPSQNIPYCSCVCRKTQSCTRERNGCR